MSGLSLSTVVPAPAEDACADQPVLVLSQTPDNANAEQFMPGDADDDMLLTIDTQENQPPTKPVSKLENSLANTTVSGPNGVQKKRGTKAERSRSLKKTFTSISLDSVPAEFKKTLQLLDFDGGGKISMEELAEAVEIVVAHHNDTKSLKISMFPIHTQELLSKFDAHGDGTIDIRDLEEAAKLLDMHQQDNKTLRRWICGMIIGFVFTMVVMVLLVWAVVTLTQQTTMKKAEMRVKTTNDLVVTATPVKYSMLTDLIAMPIEILNAMDELTFTTDDGAVQTYKKTGVKINRKTKSIDFFLLGVDHKVFINATHAYLIDSSSVPSTSKKILLPNPSTSESGRRLLAETEGAVCHANGACLLTVEQMRALHGASPVDSHGRSLLQGDQGPMGYGVVSEVDAGALMGGMSALYAMDMFAYEMGFGDLDVFGDDGWFKSIKLSSKYMDLCDNYWELNCKAPVPLWDPLSDVTAVGDSYTPYEGTVAMDGFWWFEDSMTYEKDYNTMKATIRKAHDPQRDRRQSVIMMSSDGYNFFSYDEVVDSKGKTQMMNCATNQPYLVEFDPDNYKRRLLEKSGRSSRHRKLLAEDELLTEPERRFHAHIRQHLKGFGNVHIKVDDHPHEAFNRKPFKAQREAHRRKLLHDPPTMSPPTMQFVGTPPTMSKYGSGTPPSMPPSTMPTQNPIYILPPYVTSEVHNVDPVMELTSDLMPAGVAHVQMAASDDPTMFNCTGAECDDLFYNVAIEYNESDWASNMDFAYEMPMSFYEYPELEFLDEKIKWPQFKDCKSSVEGFAPVPERWYLNAEVAAQESTSQPSGSYDATSGRRLFEQSSNAQIPSISSRVEELLQRIDSTIDKHNEFQQQAEQQEADDRRRELLEKSKLKEEIDQEEKQNEEHGARRSLLSFSAGDFDDGEKARWEILQKDKKGQWVETKWKEEYTCEKTNVTQLDNLKTKLDAFYTKIKSIEADTLMGDGVKKGNACKLYRWKLLEMGNRFRKMYNLIKTLNWLAQHTKNVMKNRWSGYGSQFKSMRETLQGIQDIVAPLAFMPVVTNGMPGLASLESEMYVVLWEVDKITQNVADVEDHITFRDYTHADALVFICNVQKAVQWISAGLDKAIDQYNLHAWQILMLADQCPSNQVAFDTCKVALDKQEAWNFEVDYRLYELEDMKMGFQAFKKLTDTANRILGDGKTALTSVKTAFEGFLPDLKDKIAVQEETFKTVTEEKCQTELVQTPIGPKYCHINIPPEKSTGKDRNKKRDEKEKWTVVKIVCGTEYEESTMKVCSNVTKKVKETKWYTYSVQDVIMGNFTSAPASVQKKAEAAAVTKLKTNSYSYSWGDIYTKVTHDYQWNGGQWEISYALSNDLLAYQGMQELPLISPQWSKNPNPTTCDAAAAVVKGAMEAMQKPVCQDDVSDDVPWKWWIWNWPC